MKKTLIYLLTAMLCASCVNELGNEMQSESKVVKFNIGFDIENEPMSRSLADYISGIEVFDYMNSEEVGRISQTSDESGFGTVQLEASFGTHQLIFVGHNSGSCEYDGSTLSFDKVTDTFSYTTNLLIDSETGSQNITMQRQVAKLTLLVNDAIPEGAAKMIITVNGYSNKLDPVTENGSEGFEYTKEWTYSESHIGATGSSYNLYTFVPSDNYRTSININVVDANGDDIYNRNVTSVPLFKNQQTTVQGSLFTAGLTAALSVSYQWNETIDVEL